MPDETTPTHPDPLAPPVGCVIAAQHVFPALMQLRGDVDHIARSQKDVIEREVTKARLELDDNNRRLTRLESIVEKQSQDFHTLSSRFDQTDHKVEKIDTKVEILLDAFSGIKIGVDTIRTDLESRFNEIAAAITSHGIKKTAEHQNRMRGQMSLWVTLGACLIILSAMHSKATGFTILESIFSWLRGLMP